MLNQQGEVAYVLNFLGQIAMWQGDKAVARQHLLESLAICQEIGDKSGAASALDKLANLIHATFGEYTESKQLALESLALSRQVGQPDWIAYALDTLGFLTFCLGEYGDAETYYRESLELFEAIDDQYGIAMAQGGIGLVLWAMWEGKYVEATAYLQKSLLICRAIGHQGQIAGRLAGLARIANDLGEYEHAQQLAQEGLAIAGELGSPIYLSHILYCLGESAYGMGDLPASRAYLMEALHVASEVGLLAYLAIALFHYATLLIKESEKDALQATQKQEKALELLALVQSHPAAWQVYKDRAARRLAELETQLPPVVVAAAKAYGANRSLDEVVAEVRSQDPVRAATPIAHGPQGIVA
jgi:tetratricopeptide (TPR) repeat protein